MNMNKLMPYCIRYLRSSLSSINSFSRRDKVLVKRPSAPTVTATSDSTLPAAAARNSFSCSQTFYRWKSKYGGMGLPEVQRLRELERENTDLKKLLADQMLKNKALEIALEKNA